MRILSGLKSNLPIGRFEVRHSSKGEGGISACKRCLVQGGRHVSISWGSCGALISTRRAYLHLVGKLRSRGELAGAFGKLTDINLRVTCVRSCACATARELYMGCSRRGGISEIYHLPAASKHGDSRVVGTWRGFGAMRRTMIPQGLDNDRVVADFCEASLQEQSPRLRVSACSVLARRRRQSRRSARNGDAPRTGRAGKCRLTIAMSLGRCPARQIGGESR